MEENEKIYTITLADGTQINNLRVNGNNFISDTIIEADMFLGKCSRVVINDGNSENTYENLELVQIAKHNEEYWFVLEMLTKEELQRLKDRADIDYIAMMTDVDI